MIDFLVRNRSIILILLLWLITGIYFKPAMYVLAVLSIFLLWRKKLYSEIFIAFFFILICSDNLTAQFEFARSFKNIFIVLIFLIALLDRRQFAPFNRLFLMFIPFLIVASVALLYSETLILSIQKTISYALLFFAVPQFVNKSFRDKKEIFFKDLVFFATIIIISSLILRFLEPELALSHGGRFRGIFGNPNGMGIFLILVFILLSVSQEYFKNAYSKADLRWIIIPLMIAVILTGSRTAVIGIALFIILMRFYAISPLLGFIIFFLIAFVTEFIAFNIVSILEYLQLDDFFRVETIEGGSGRFIAWEFAWQNIQDNFWIGRGFAFDEWLMAVNQDVLNDLGHQGGVHNTFLIIWLNAGIIGLLLFLRAFFLLFIRGAKNTALALPAMWLIIFSIFFEPWLAASLNPYTIIFLTIVTLISGTEYQPYIKQETSELEPSTQITGIA